MANLSDFTYYANRSIGGIDDPNSDRAQQALTAIRQYDQNAQYRPSYGSDGQLLGYTLDFDASKLPGVNGSGSLGATSGHGSGADYMPRFSTVQQNMHLSDPNAVVNSPVYGKITDNRNIQQIDDWIAKGGGPALVAAFGFGFPALMESLGFGAGSAATGAASGGFGMSPDELATTTMTGNSGFSGALGDGVGGLGINPDTLATAGMTGNSGFSGALDGAAAGTQAAAPITELGTPARVGDVIRNGFLPGISNIGQSLSELGLSGLGQVANAVGKIPGIAGGSGGGGGGLLGLGGGGTYNAQPYNSLLGLLRRFQGTNNG